MFLLAAIVLTPIGAMVYAAGVRRSSRILRGLGVTIAFGSWVVAAGLTALTTGE